MTAGLRGASAESLAQLRQRLAGATDAARVGDDLFGVAALLRAEPSLRRIATDAATDAAAKSGLVRSVLEGKVAAESLDLAGAAAGLRWTASRDLADALEHLGVEAIVSSAGDAGRLEDELFSVGQLVNDNHELRNALSDPARSASDKAALLTALLDGKALPATIKLAQQSLAGSYRTVSVALEEFGKIAAEVNGQGVARVTVAKPLSDADLQRLTDGLSRQYGRPIHANVEVDPEVLGGIRVEIGDDVIDGSVASRLDAARRKLAG